MSDLKRPGNTSDAGQQHYTLDLTNVTLREALNAIARSNGKGVWEYRERHCNAKYEFQIQFLVR